jgi:hypothetical protein
MQKRGGAERKKDTRYTENKNKTAHAKPTILITLSVT